MWPHMSKSLLDRIIILMSIARAFETTFVFLDTFFNIYTNRETTKSRF